MEGIFSWIFHGFFWRFFDVGGWDPEDPARLISPWIAWYPYDAEIGVNKHTLRVAHYGEPQTEVRREFLL